MNPKLLILIFSLFFLKGYSQPAENVTDAKGLKQGKWVKKNEKNKVIYEGTFKDDQPTGEFRYYYDTGEIQAISVFSGNGKICRSKLYFPGNILMAEGKYINQQKDSTWKFYNAPNALVSEENYNNGKKNGTEKVFDGKNHIVELRNWKNGVLEGTYVKYYVSGDVQEEGNYKNGLIEGEVKFYFPGKKIAVSGSYVHSLKNGRWVHRSGNGVTNTLIETYKSGNLDGYYAEWYEKDGTPKVKGEYKQGKKNNKWSFFNEKGKLLCDSTFSLGFLHGLVTAYYENGSKQSEMNFYYSHKTGKYTEWDESGKITKEENFPAIEEVKKIMWKEEQERQKTGKQ